MKKVLNRRTIKGIIFYSVFAILSFLSNSASAQVKGCTDSLANNYNASAAINDGSCTYDKTSYNSSVKLNALADILVETSGLQFANDYLWSFNDGGGSAAIYRIDTTTKTILQTVTLGAATNVDWEDIAFDGQYFYIGDFGNNHNGARTDLKIYKFAINLIPDYKQQSEVTIPASAIEEIKFIYADQPQPLTPSLPNHTRFDCEAMIVDTVGIHLFSKNWLDNTTTHYIIKKGAEEKSIATPIETLETGYLVTAADKADGDGAIVLFGYQLSGLKKHFLHLLTDYKDGKFFNGNKRKINLQSALVMGQGEGITFRNSTYGYISNERVFSINQKLRSFDISRFLPHTNSNALKGLNAGVK